MKTIPSETIYRVFLAIAKTNSTNEKQRLLKHVPEAKPVLKWAYNPYWNYYVRDIHLEGTGTEPLNSVTFLILRNLRDRKITGNDARRELINHATHLSHEAAILLNRILQRDLRIGMNVKTINAVFPGLIPSFDVMLASKVDFNKLRYPLWSSAKLDGVRGIYRDGAIYTRSGVELKGLDHILEQLNGYDYEVDGELIVPDTTFQVGSGMIRSDNPTPTAVFQAFEIPDCSGSFEDRLRVMDESDWGPHIELIPHRLVTNPDEIMFHYHKCRSEGFEGTVVKSFDYHYQQKRSRDWMKLKAIETLDLEVVGIFEGTGKYKCMLGGMYVDHKGVTVRVGSGFSDAEREKFWAKPPLGQKIEVLYQEETDDGSLRHPRFVTVRWDK